MSRFATEPYAAEVSTAKMTARRRRPLLRLGSGFAALFVHSGIKPQMPPFGESSRPPEPAVPIRLVDDEGEPASVDVG